MAGRPDSKVVARRRGFELASAHLRDGHDVVLPQLLVRVDVIEHLERVAHGAGAELVEVVLLADPDELIERLAAAPPPTGPGHPRDLFDTEALSSQIRHALDSFRLHALARPHAHLIDVTGLAGADAADRVVAAIGWR